MTTSTLKRLLFPPLSRLVLLGVFLALAACSPTTQFPQTPNQSRQVTLELNQGEDGELEFCDEDGQCESHPNPNDCAILLLEVNTVTGETCERCLNEEGEVTMQRCGETSLACVVVTLPDPDCVVCAYVDGDVIYSSCLPEEPERCISEVRPDGVECERCYDSQGNLLTDECTPDCRDIACPQIRCAHGYHPVTLPGDCCQTCVEDDPIPDRHCASSQDCRNNEVCSVEFGECNPPPDCRPGEDCAAVCYGVCRPAPNCEDVLCIAPPPECPPGTYLELEAPHCCGACLPDTTCEEPDPSLTCRTTGCEEGFVCRESAATVCVPSECFCDGESREWICTDDCRPAMACVPEMLRCEGPNPALTCHERGCPDHLECRPSGEDGCVPSACECDGQSGQWVCTADCGEMVACLPPENACEDPDPSLTCRHTGCPEGEQCRPSGEDGCVPSRCKCNQQTGEWACTRDCRRPLACLPIEGSRCESHEDCRPWERCASEDHINPHPSSHPDTHRGGRCVPLED
ncbi:MAG: hypothetical protein VX699_12910 [Myxococcota bacterium]|nr:hypothetical protein [Myxococcota bacterium]